MEVDYESDHSFNEVLRKKEIKSKLKDLGTLKMNENSKLIQKTKREKEKGRLEVIREILMKNKLELMKKNFISKLRLNSVFRSVPQDDINDFEEDDGNSFFSNFLKMLEKR